MFVAFLIEPVYIYRPPSNVNATICFHAEESGLSIHRQVILNTSGQHMNRTTQEASAGFGQSFSCRSSDQQIIPASRTLTRVTAVHYNHELEGLCPVGIRPSGSRTANDPVWMLAARRGETGPAGEPRLSRLAACAPDRGWKLFQCQHGPDVTRPRDGLDLH